MCGAGKLSPTTEQSLVAKIQALDVNSLPLLERVVERVFDTALSNKFFQDLYAALCQKLSRQDQWVVEFIRVCVSSLHVPWAALRLISESSAASLCSRAGGSKTRFRLVVF